MKIAFEFRKSSENLSYLRYFVECVSKIKHILSVIHYTICGVYVFSLPISLVMIERIYILCLIIIIKSEVWTIPHCLGLGHETMVSAVCLSIFLWVCNIAHPIERKGRHYSYLISMGSLKAGNQIDRYSDDSSWKWRDSHHDELPTEPPP